MSRLWLAWSLRIKKGLPYSSKAKLPTDAILETMDDGMLKIFIDFTHFTSKILEPSRFLHVHLAGSQSVVDERSIKSIFGLYVVFRDFLKY